MEGHSPGKIGADPANQANHQNPEVDSEVYLYQKGCRIVVFQYILAGESPHPPWKPGGALWVVRP